MSRAQILRRRIRFLTWLFIIGLLLSGATAIPLESELDWLIRGLGSEQRVNAAASKNPPDWALWLLRVREALSDTNAKYPFVAYGFDWLAFGHFVIAIAFVGALRDPLRNIWLFQFGLIACVLLVPYALVLGGLRGIPIAWRLIDCSFGVFGFIPLWLCQMWAAELAEKHFPNGGPQPPPGKYVFSHSHARHVLRQTKLRRPRRCQGCGTGVPPVRIVQPTHGRDARATTV